MSQWIAGIATGHNAGICLLKDGEIIFSVEEERLSKIKHDGGPILSMMKILDYTDKIDYLVVTGLKFHPDSPMSSLIEYSGESLYQGIARRLGLNTATVLPPNEWDKVVHSITSFKCMSSRQGNKCLNCKA